MFELVQIVSLLVVSFFPAGLAISICTARLASQSILSKTLPRFWNTFVTCAISYLSWRYLIFLQWPGGDTRFAADCTLDSLSYWLPKSDGHNSVCTPSDALEITVILGLRCMLFALGAKLGTALQPVGLTGGIACGKSTVSTLLRDPSKKGRNDAFAVVDVDAIAHDILVPGKMGSDCGYRRVVKVFSSNDIFISKSDSKDPLIDRRKLGDIIFRDASKRRILNGITHPLISKIMLKQIIFESIAPSSRETSVVSVDIPLLYEVGLQMRLLFGIKIVVACDESIQLERLMARNKDLTREQCVGRIQSQIPIYKKAEMADIVIWNNGTRKDLVLQVEKARREVLNRSHAFGGITLPKFILACCILTISSCILEVTKHSGSL